MLGKVIAEPALHAGGPLVGSVQLDVRGGDTDYLFVGDVQVHLAPHAAVGADGPDDPVWMADLVGGEPLPRHHFEDRAGRADADALAAPGAPRLVGVAVGTDDDLGVLAPESDVQHADHLNVLARPHATRTQNAGGHVVADHRIAGPLVARTEGKVARFHERGGHAVAHNVALELVAGAGAATVAQMIRRVALEQQPQHALAVLHGRMRLGRHDHPVRDLGGARGEQLGLALDRHEADAAVAHDRQLRVPAQRRYVDPGGPGRIEDGPTFRRSDGAAVDRERRHTGIDIAQ